MKHKIIDKAKIKDAMEELMRYARERRHFSARMEEEEQFYRSRVLPHRSGTAGETPQSAWLVNTVLQKHADLMEHIPTATCFAREPGDEADAKALSTILPVILERNHFDEIYSDNMWQKLKHGVCAFGVFWNTQAENGLGDIEVCRVDMANLYWQGDVRDIQASRSVFLVEKCDAAALRARFPHYTGEGATCELPELSVSGAEGEDSVIVVDWYYKKRLPDGRTVLHYCKFAGDTVLFSSENEEGYEDGWYEHGMYPFVLDVLYPVEGECTGFGLIALARDPQLYIDRIDRNLLEYMDWATRVRFFCKKNTGINEKEFSDLSRRIVEVEGDLDEVRLRQIRVDDLASFWLNLKNEKINELKETTSNRDILRGSPEGGVTAAAAIAALQEVGNKSVRDVVAASYRAFLRVVQLMLECVRQFYHESRYFRILGEDGAHRYITFSNAGMREKVTGTWADGTPRSRRPIFDIDVRAERKDPYTRLSHNETMKDLYRMGVFQKENADAASILLSGMDFSGIARLRAQVEAQAGGVQSPHRPSSEGEGHRGSYDALARAMAGAQRVAAESEERMR